MNSQTNRIICRIISAFLLIYALINIYFLVRWINGNENGYLNLGIPFLIAMSLGIWFHWDWARKMLLFLSMAAIVVGILCLLIPLNALQRITFFYINHR